MCHVVSGHPVEKNIMGQFESLARSSEPYQQDPTL